ncbi:hypothetical protein Adt_47476 [Abeliophyllum distichum]|uniref:Uncharacterized protein n=1 Tax=Abeliophyllum distichum TaxID=126358 RepID=A0ABD1NTX3_9LAMI
MSSEVGNDSRREALSCGRSQEEQVSSDRMVEGIDKDEVLSPALLTTVLLQDMSSPRAEMSGDRETGTGALGQYEWEIDFPRPSVWEFNSMYSFKSDGKKSKWWYASVKVKTGGSAITQTLDSIKNWKKFWFFVRGQSREAMNDISALLKKNGMKGKRKTPARGQEQQSRPRQASETTPQRIPSSARSVEKITSFLVRRGPSSSQPFRPSLQPSQIPPTYLGSTLNKDEEYLRLRGTILKPVRDFFRSNSPPRDEISSLSPTVKKEIQIAAKSWTPVQQKYIESMEVVESIIVASVNSSRTIIQLVAAVEKMERILNEVQVMKEEGRKVFSELTEERKVRAMQEDGLVDKDGAVEEFKLSEAYLAEQEKVYFFTMEELIDMKVEKRPDWDVQFLKDELVELKKNSKLNPPSLEEGAQSGAKE